MKIVFRALFVLWFAVYGQAAIAAKKTKKSAKKTATPQKSIKREKASEKPVEKSPSPSPEREKPSKPSPEVANPPASSQERALSETETRYSSFKIHSYLGLLAAKNSSIAFGLGAALPISDSSLWMFGLELGYTKPTGGSLYSILAGAWREFPVYGTSRLSVGVGGLVGPVFAASGTGYPGVTYATFANLGLAKEIDELAVVRAEFRPGFIAGRFAFLMNFGVSFRFL